MGLKSANGDGWMKPNKVRGKYSFHLHITSAGIQLSSEAVEGPSLPLQGVHHIHGSHGLPFGMFGVGDGVTDDVLQEDLKTRLLENIPTTQLP